MHSLAVLPAHRGHRPATGEKSFKRNPKTFPKLTFYTFSFSELCWICDLAGDRFGGLCSALPAMEVSRTKPTDQGAPDLACTLHSVFNIRNRAAMFRRPDGHRSGCDHYSDRRSGVRPVYRVEIEAGVHQKCDRFVYRYNSEAFARRTSR